MKYIKLFEAFTNLNLDDDKDVEDMCIDIENILQDCVDLCFDVAVYEPCEFILNAFKEEIYGLRVSIDYDSDISSQIYKFSDIKEDIEHLISYLNDKGFDTYYYRDHYDGFNIDYNKTVPPKKNYLPDDTNQIGSIMITFWSKNNNR